MLLVHSAVDEQAHAAVSAAGDSFCLRLGTAVSQAIPSTSTSTLLLPPSSCSTSEPRPPVGSSIYTFWLTQIARRCLTWARKRGHFGCFSNVCNQIKHAMLYGSSTWC